MISISLFIFQIKTFSLQRLTCPAKEDTDTYGKDITEIVME